MTVTRDLPGDVVTNRPFLNQPSVIAAKIKRNPNPSHKRKATSWDGVEGVHLHAEDSNYSDLLFERVDTDAIRIAGVRVGTLRTF